MMKKTSLFVICLSLILSSIMTNIAGADTVSVSIFFDGLDLDAGIVERDRSILLLIMGQTIEELLRPAQEYLADFSQPVDLSFEFDPVQEGLLELVLQDQVKIAVLHNTSFEDVTTATLGTLTFTDAPYSVLVSATDVVVAKTAEQQYFKLGGLTFVSVDTIELLVENLPVPEPSMLLLLGLGGIGLIGLLRLKKRSLVMLAAIIVCSLLGARTLHAEDSVLIKKAGTGAGTVLAGEQVCGPECQEVSIPYSEHRAVVLKAIPETGSLFDRWETAQGSSLENTIHVQPGETVLAVFATRVPSDGLTVSLPDGSASVTFPPEALTEPLYVSIVKTFPEGPASTPVYDIRALNAQGNPVAHFPAELTITLAHDPAAFSGTYRHELVVAYFDEDLQQWVALPSVMNPAAYTVTGWTNHLTDYQIISPCPAGVLNCKPSDLQQPPEFTRNQQPTYEWVEVRDDSGNNFSSISVGENRYCLTVLGSDYSIEMDCRLAKDICGWNADEKKQECTLSPHTENLAEGKYQWQVGTWRCAEVGVPPDGTCLIGNGKMSDFMTFTVDKTPPTPGGDGLITTSNIQAGGVTLEWTRATDNSPGSDQAMLRYRVYYADTDYQTREAWETHGTPSDDWPFGTDVEEGWAKDVHAKVITGLNSGDYYFNVLVKDQAGNKAAYDNVGPVTIPGPNKLPDAVDDTAVTEKNAAITIDVLANDDPGDPPAAITNVSNPLNGTAQIVNNKIVYTPNADFTGKDMFSYTLTDNNGDKDVALVTVTINDIPQSACLVRSAADSGSGSLRQVLADAEQNDCSTISFASNVSEIKLDSQLEIPYSTEEFQLTIDGGTHTVTLDGQEKTRIFYVYAADRGAELTFRNLIITNGNAGVNEGGGIYNYEGILTIGTGMIIKENTAEFGGGVYNTGYGNVKLEGDAIVENNTAEVYGGGIFNNWGMITIEGTIENNTAKIDGGGIYNEDWFGGVPNYGVGNSPNNCAGPGGCGCTVINQDDSGPGSLRQVLADAEQNDCSTISFASDVSEIKLDSQLEIPATSGMLTIGNDPNGPSPNHHVTISGQDKTRVFYVNSGADVTFQNLTITRGYAWALSNEGGGIYNYRGTVTIGAETKVTGNNAMSGGGIHCQGGTVIVNGTVSSNGAGGFFGGGISNGESGMIVVNGTVSDNRGVEGGGIGNWEGGTVEVNSTGQIVRNWSSGSGGGIWNLQGTVIVRGMISDNTSLSDGGGIKNDYGTLTLSGWVIGNTATRTGGGIYNSGTMTGTPNYGIGNTPNNCTCVVTNAADSGPGSLRQILGNAMVNGCNMILFDSNISSTITVAGQLMPPAMALTIDGSAIGNRFRNMTISGGNRSGVFYVIDGAEVTFMGLTITEGNAVYDGGGIFNNSGTVIIGNNCKVENNTASNYGGGIYNNQGTVTIKNGGIVSTNSAKYGGGIYTNYGRVLVDGIVSGNTATGAGGIDNYMGTVTIGNDGKVTENAATHGAGIGNNGGTLTIDGVVSNNTASPSYPGGVSDGGGIANSGTVIVNGSVNTNTATRGGGIDNNTGTVTININGTVSNNTATDSGGGIYNLWGTISVKGTVSGNVALISRAGGIYTYASNPPGGGIVTGNPLTMYGSGNTPTNCIASGVGVCP